jgi:hypothetical protein
MDVREPGTEAGALTVEDRVRRLPAREPIFDRTPGLYDAEPLGASSHARPGRR